MALSFVLMAALFQGTAAHAALRPRSAGVSAMGKGAETNAGTVVAPEDEIGAVLREQVAAWNRGDVRAFMQGYWNSPETEFVSVSGVTRGWRTVLERYQQRYPDRAAMGHLTFSGLEITLLGPAAALVVGRWHLQRKPKDVGGIFTLVFRKFPEGWRIINDHTSQSP